MSLTHDSTAHHPLSIQQPVPLKPKLTLQAEDVENERVNLGIIICGSGNGASMTANKHQGIRAALCWNKEIVELAREHNDANILSLPARFISLNQALDMVKIFLNTKFEGGRHERRVEKISCN